MKKRGGNSPFLRPNTIQALATAPKNIKFRFSIKAPLCWERGHLVLRTEYFSRFVNAHGTPALPAKNRKGESSKNPTTPQTGRWAEKKYACISDSIFADFGNTGALNAHSATPFSRSDQGGFIMNGTIPCQNCGKQLPPNWQWFQCSHCGFRVCPACLSQHKGPYGMGGYKCSRCAFGQLRSTK